MAPTLIGSELVLSGGSNNNTLTSSSFTPSNGDVIIVKASTWDTANGFNTPTGGSQTYAPINIVSPGGYNGWCGLWAATVAGSPGSMTVSCAPATGASTRHSMMVERWSGGKLAATPATNSTVSGTGATATTTLTTAANNSIVSWLLFDENSRDPASSTYDTSTGTVTQDGLDDGHNGANGVWYYAHQTAATLGSQTFGVSNTLSLAWTAAGIEIQDAAGVQDVDPTGIATSEAFGTLQVNLTLSLTGIISGEAFGTVTLAGGARPDSTQADLQGELNRLAKTTGLDEALAANIWAGTTAFMYKTVGAINAKAGTWGLDLDGACNAAAGTAGLAGPGALQTIPTPA